MVFAVWHLPGVWKIISGIKDLVLIKQYITFFVTVFAI